MDSLVQAYTEMSLLMQIFWGCAIVGSLVMVIQLLLSIIGGGDVDVDSDVDIF